MLCWVLSVVCLGFNRCDFVMVCGQFVLVCSWFGLVVIVFLVCTYVGLVVFVMWNV